MTHEIRTQNKKPETRQLCSLEGLMLLVFFGCIFMLSAVGVSQTPPMLKRDTPALALAQQVISSNGGPLSGSSGTSMTGTLRIGKDATTYPMRVFTLGNAQTRTEVDRPDGMSVRVLNKGKAALRQSTGKVMQLNMLNTVAERVPYIPAFSLLSEYTSPNMQLEYLGSANLSGVNVEKIAVSLGEGVTAADQLEFLKRTKVVYSIVPGSYQVVQMEYDLCAERDSNAVRHYRLVYSDYTTMGGRKIPTTITIFSQDIFDSEFKITSYIENVDVSSVSFALPEVTK